MNIKHYQIFEAVQNALPGEVRVYRNKTPNMIESWYNLKLDVLNGFYVRELLRFDQIEVENSNHFGQDWKLVLDKDLNILGVKSRTVSLNIFSEGFVKGFRHNSYIYFVEGIDLTNAFKHLHKKKSFPNMLLEYGIKK